ncbi:methyltransferase domain-containing protein [Capnocytophaga gingivalis]|uniref:methyltransferase domain-containing protein n=1 Tax=Capnocytophaga gingivalis TaxID=1017 RepID=UPI00403E07B0
MLDLLGHSLLDYQNGDRSSDVYVQTNISHREYLSRAHFFRSFSQMIPIEQQALTLSQGRTLDVGAGTGSHVLYLQEKGIEAIALDISPSAIEICKQRGVRVAICCDILQYEGQADTILMLMNGIGLCQKLSLLDTYLQKLKTLLTPHGQILLTSTDIIYMFDQDEDGSYLVPVFEDTDYYGELTYTITYKGKKESFPWLFIDYNTLQNAAHHNGLLCELIAEGEAYNYLARLRREA